MYSLFIIYSLLIIYYEQLKPRNTAELRSCIAAAAPNARTCEPLAAVATLSVAAPQRAGIKLTYTRMHAKDTKNTKSTKDTQNTKNTKNAKNTKNTKNTKTNSPQQQVALARSAS